MWYSEWTLSTHLNLCAATGSTSLTLNHAYHIHNILNEDFLVDQTYIYVPTKFSLECS